MDDFNQALCKRLHVENDREHGDMWKHLSKTDSRVDKVLLMLFANFVSTATALVILIITNWPS